MVASTLLALSALSSSPALALGNTCMPYEICGNNIDDDCDGKVNEGCGGGGGGLGGGGLGDINLTPIGPGPTDAYPIPDLWIMPDTDGSVNVVFATASFGGGQACMVNTSGGLPEREMDLTTLCGHAGDAEFLGDSAHDIGVGAAFAAMDLDGDGADEWFVGSPLNDAAGRETGLIYGVAGRDGSYSLPGDASSLLYGNNDGDMAGWALDSFTGSAGAQVLAVSAPQDSYAAANGGAVYLFHSGNAATNVQDADGALFGADSDDLLGTAMVSVDLDGDGVDNLVLGAPGADTYAEDAGSVYIVMDDRSWAWVGDASHELYGVYGGGEAGADVAVAGDVDGDGLEDLIVGAPLAGGTYGVAHVVYGGRGYSAGAQDPITSGGTMLIGQRGDEAGNGVSGGGDVDGDGLADVWVGAPAQSSDTGAAYLVLGASMRRSSYVRLSGADAMVVGDNPGDLFGAMVRGDADLNGDGANDLLLYAPGMVDASGNVGMIRWAQTWSSSTSGESTSGR